MLSDLIAFLRALWSESEGGSGESDLGPFVDPNG